MKILISYICIYTVDGRNPTPPWMVEPLQVMGFSQPFSTGESDFFFHPQYSPLRPSKKSSAGRDSEAIGLGFVLLLFLHLTAAP